MRPIRATLQLLAGLALGAALGYGAMRWLRGMERDMRAKLTAPAPEGRALSAAAPAPEAEKGFLDHLADRFRGAMEEGRRAADAARAELEAELKAPPRAQPTSPGM